MSCGGNENDKCGGEYANNIYSTNCKFEKKLILTNRQKNITTNFTSAILQWF